MIAVFFRKWNWFIIVSKDKVFYFFDRHLFYRSGNIEGINYYIYENTKSKKQRYDRNEKITWKNEDNK